ncbi:hypothetical protein AX15_005564 [Amanita polypyramis BW_CC]|nr:hypothetical protein AX15_005564 [Amanita polypyramis BW_CC]
MLVRFPDMPSVINFSTLPSNAAILVSLFAALVFLVLVHAAYLLVREYAHRAKQHFEQKKVCLVAQEQGQGVSSPSLSLSKSEPKKIERSLVTASALEQQTRIPVQGKWGSGLLGWFKWEKTLPVSLSGAPRSSVVKGSAVPPARGPAVVMRQVHMSAPPRPGSETSQQPPSAPHPNRGQTWQQVRRSGPAFETPVPTLYQTDVPASMAKIIMSRHTYRKPTQRSPSRSPSPSSQIQISRRPPSIV